MDDWRSQYLPKQLMAIDMLARESDKRLVLFGGSAGPGKTWLGCRWQIMRRIMYNGTRSVIGRSDLSNLKKTTLNTFFEVAEQLSLRSGDHFKYNSNSNVITFYNESEIILKDLFAYPSDPNFDDLGSLELFDFFVDEASQTTRKAIAILSSRCRHKLTHFCRKCGHEGLNTGQVVEYRQEGSIRKPIKWKCLSCGDENKGMIPKGLLASNPHKGHLYQDFYKPSKEGTLKDKYGFVQALPSDNPYLSDEYIENLMGLPEEDRKRLMDGDWDYDESIDRIFNIDDALRCFRNELLAGEKYITADIARFGKDRTVIGLWDGWTLTSIHVMRKASVTEVVEKIRELIKAHGAKLSNVIADEDGVGGGVVDSVKCKGFLNGSRAPHPERFANLKAECYYKLGEIIERNGITFVGLDQYREVIVKELDVIRRKNPEGDTKLSVTSKDEIQRQHGFSPDIADMIMMRAYFDLIPNYGKYSWA